MIATNKVKGKIIAEGKTIRQVAAEMCLTPYTLGQKINNKTSTTLEEALQLQNILKITDEEFHSYFFYQSCCKTQHKN